MTAITAARRVALLALATATAASASVDTTARPGGVVPLKPGIYVARGSTCRDAPNAAIRDYDRRGFATPHSRACRARVLSKRGTTYAIEQSCMDAGAGPAPRVGDRFSVSVDNAITFRLRRNGGSTEYRYCPVYQLPAGVRPRVR
ncbi:hypothetical protein [Sphingomonas aracearum]|uniref:Uncharacterized protein n=1 Tax=Sphingomonas aracearum TaxID=2283317 RepID=A0A369W1U0_9SPHN|nr:hypothetical protein [Sphingomonas aracearum]RDE07242.1 hypothetical protein DVW87_06320 [Sphingomonas aracearum]